MAPAVSTSRSASYVPFGCPHHGPVPDGSDFPVQHPFPRLDHGPLRLRRPHVGDDGPLAGDQAALGLEHGAGGVQASR